MKNVYTRLDMVRHGEVATPGLLCAERHEPLSETGRAQLAHLDKGLGWEVIISSPSRRCSEPARALAEQLRLPLEIVPDWREIDFGNWTGMPRKHIWENERERLLSLWSSPLEFTPPGGEPMRDFVARVQAALDKLLTQHAARSILLLTHAGAIRAVLAHALGIDYHSAQKLTIGHGKLNRLHAWPDGEFSLITLGNTVTGLKTDDT